MTPLPSEDDAGGASNVVSVFRSVSGLIPTGAERAAPSGRR